MFRSTTMQIWCMCIQIYWRQWSDIHYNTCRWHFKCIFDKWHNRKIIKYLKEQYEEVNEVTNTATHLWIRWIRLRDGSIKINQPGYIDKMMKKMNMENCDTVQAPIIWTFTREKNRMTTQIKQATGGDILEEKQNELRKIIGLLNHIAIHTRPDILFAVSRLSTNIMNANDEYIHDGKYIIKYLKGTKDLGMTFSTKV